MLTTALLATVFSLIWMLVTASVTLGGFVVGLLLGAAIVFFLKVDNIQINWRYLPGQCYALVVYVVTLARDVWNCSIDVAKRVLSPSMPLNPGIIAVKTQDTDESDFIAAFSAHGITITPGELVVDFDGNHTMYVHCLDVSASSQSVDAAQAKRLKLLHKIMGRDS